MFFLTNSNLFCIIVIRKKSFIFGTFSLAKKHQGCTVLGGNGLKEKILQKIRNFIDIDYKTLKNDSFIIFLLNPKNY